MIPMEKKLLFFAVWLEFQICFEMSHNPWDMKEIILKTVEFLGKESYCD